MEKKEDTRSLRCPPRSDLTARRGKHIVTHVTCFQYNITISPNSAEICARKLRIESNEASSGELAKKIIGETPPEVAGQMREMSACRRGSFGGEGRGPSVSN